MNTSRRRFFGVLAAAPAAVPVVLKEAASKLGLEGALGGSIAGGASGTPAMPQPAGGNWVKKAIKNFWSKSSKRERAQTVEWQSRRLDPDLASLRSISPAAAYQIQRGRYQVRVEEQSWEYLQDTLHEQLSNGAGL